MKHFVFLILLIFAVAKSVFCQPENTYFSRLGGLQRDEYSFFELEGYDIVVQTFIQPFDEKGIKKIRKQAKIPKEAIGTYDSAIVKNNIKFDTQKSFVKNEVHYLVPKREQSTYYISFFAMNKRDIELERMFVNDFIQDKIPDSIYEKSIPNSIRFAGRNIELGNNCNWMGVHNIQCPYYGQMNWSLHRTEEDALKVLEAEYQSTKSKSMGEIKEEKQLDVEFEGVPTKAKRLVYKIKMPKFVLGGSNVLIIYYVVAKVRGNYVQCVMSHYTNDSLSNTGLPPLLEQVMKLK